jgi:hypothetical protein
MERVRRKADAVLRKKDFILAHGHLILAALTVGVIDSQHDSLFAIIMLSIVAVGVTIYSVMLDAFAFYDRVAQSLFVVVDTALVFGILLVAGVGRSVSVPFFLTLMATAMLENPLLLSPAVLLIAVLSVFFAGDTVFDPASAIARPVLIMATALFYWYVVAIDREGEAAPPPAAAGI